MSAGGNGPISPRGLSGIVGTAPAGRQQQDLRQLRRQAKAMDSHRRERSYAAKNPNDRRALHDARVEFGAQALRALRDLLPEPSTKAERAGEKRAKRKPSRAARFIEGPSSNWTEK